MAKDTKEKKQPKIFYADPMAEELAKDEASGEPSLSKSLLNLLNRGQEHSLERLAFEVDPQQINVFQALYKPKLKLIPDFLLKRIIIQDDLVASIVQARQNHLSTFGRPRPDRFSNGYVIEPKLGVLDHASDEEKKDLDKRIERAIKLLRTCGHTKGWDDEDQLTFSQYLSESCRNAIGVGRIATEIIWTTGPDGKKAFHSFRPADAGTIYRAAPQKQAAESVRKQARHLLEQLKNKKLEPEPHDIDPSKYEEDYYAWVQVIDGRPVQAFTSQEMIVYNFYKIPDVEMNGYPVTPLDTVIAAVTTHINITSHNKLYFQSGRASKGMLIIQSDDADEQVVTRIKQQFNAAINSAANSWRMPVFSVGKEDSINWQPIDAGGTRDMEFQYLADSNARSILSAFQISPDELPGWGYLSRGTNSQALSESNQEYKLTSARDVGLRPLIAHFEDFLNDRILPLIDDKVAKLCHLSFMGLDSDTAEKQSVRMLQDSPLFLTYSEILEKVEKKPVDKKFGGYFPFNPSFQAILDKYFTVGQILEEFMDVEGASKDPSLAYVRDQFWFQWQQLQMQNQQMQQQAQMAQQQQQQAPQGPPQGTDQGPAPQAPQGDASVGQPWSQSQMDGQQAGPAIGTQEGSQESDLTRSIDQALDLLTKSEDKLPPGRRRLLVQHRKTVENFLKGFEEDLKEAEKEILDVTEHFTKK